MRWLLILKLFYKINNNPVDIKKHLHDIKNYLSEIVRNREAGYRGYEKSERDFGRRRIVTTIEKTIEIG